MFLQESLTGQSNGGLTKLLMERLIKVHEQAYKLLHGKVWDDYLKVYGQKSVTCLVICTSQTWYLTGPGIPIV